MKASIADTGSSGVPGTYPVHGEDDEITLRSGVEDVSKALMIELQDRVAKAGVIMLTKVMARELAGAGLRFNSICPGQVMTDLEKWRFGLEAEEHYATGTYTSPVLDLDP